MSSKRRRGGVEFPPLPRRVVHKHRKQEPALWPARPGGNSPQTKGYPMKGLTDTDQRLMLSELTEATVNAAAAVIARHAIDRADLLDLLDKVRPTPHTPDQAAPARRAMPLRGVSAR